MALASGFLLQTTGLQHTLAGVSGFLTGAAVILTPVAAAAFFHEQVGRAGWAGRPLHRRHRRPRRRCLRALLRGSHAHLAGAA